MIEDLKMLTVDDVLSLYGIEEELLGIGDIPNFCPFDELDLEEDQIEIIKQDYIERFGAEGVLDPGDYLLTTFTMETKEKEIWSFSIANHYEEL